MPQKIVDGARSVGILDSARVARLLEAEIERQRKLNEFSRLLDELRADLDKPTPEEIDEKVRLYREGKRQKQATQLEALQQTP